MGQNPLDKVIDCQHTPKFKNCSDLGSVIIHEEPECVEGGDVESQQLTNLFNAYLMNNTIP